MVLRTVIGAMLCGYCAECNVPRDFKFKPNDRRARMPGDGFSRHDRRYAAAQCGRGPRQLPDGSRFYAGATAVGGGFASAFVATGSLRAGLWGALSAAVFWGIGTGFSQTRAVRTVGRNNQRALRRMQRAT